MPHWCISVALERRTRPGSEIVAGCIYNPVNDEMFWAEKGVGAFLNERRLRVSARRELKDALFATGIPFAAVPAGRRLAFARTLGTLMPVVAGMRRFGAAALDLAWVAAGRYDGYWELGPKPWDVAAGALIVREAGGYATDRRAASCDWTRPGSTSWRPTRICIRVCWRWWPRASPRRPRRLIAHAAPGFARYAGA